MLYTEETIRGLTTITALKKAAKEMKEQGYIITGYSTWKPADKNVAINTLIGLLGNHANVDDNVHIPQYDVSQLINDHLAGRKITMATLKEYGKNFAVPGYSKWRAQDRDDIIKTLQEYSGQPQQPSPQSLPAQPRACIIDDDNVADVILSLYEYLGQRFETNDERNAVLHPFFTVIDNNEDNEAELQIDEENDQAAIDEVEEVDDVVIEPEEEDVVDYLDHEERSAQADMDAQADIIIDDFGLDERKDELPDNNMLSLLNVETPRFIKKQTKFINPEEMAQLLKDIEKTPSKVDVLRNYPEINSNIQKCLGIQIPDSNRRSRGR